MKIRAERDVLAEAVAWAARPLPVRPPVPVLAGLLLEARDGELTLSGFDYEVSARVRVPAEVSEPGRALVSGRLLADIGRSLPGRPVEIVAAGTASDRKVILSCGSTRFQLQTLPDEDYPTLPDMPPAVGTLPGELLATAVGQVTLAAGRDDTLPVLTGVRMEIEDERVVLAATDRYRLAVRELRWSPEQSSLSTVALVPARTLADAAKALGASDKVLVGLSTGGTGEGLIGFDGSAGRLTTRLLDGEFPKYRSLLPTESSTLATVETAPLIESVRRVSLVAERNTPVRLHFMDGAVRLEAGSGENAEASETLDAALEGDSLSIAFNPGYLLDGLGAVGAPATRMSFTSPTKPAVLTGSDAGAGEAAGSFRYLLMPVRLSG